MRLLVATPACSFILAAPLAAAFLLTPDWRSWFGIQPPAFGFVPNAGATIGYGMAFAFGWLVHTGSGMFEQMRRWWIAQIALAVLFTAYCLAYAGTIPDLDPTPKNDALTLYAICYAIAVWAWTFGLLGAAIRYLDAERPVVRYLADSSYWIYLIHPPVLGVFHIALYGLPLPALVKYPLALAGTMIVMLASYELMVRHSFLGRWLNGRKFRAAKRVTAAAAAE